MTSAAPLRFMPHARTRSPLALSHAPTLALATGVLILFTSVPEYLLLARHFPVTPGQLMMAYTGLVGAFVGYRYARRAADFARAPYALIIALLIYGALVAVSLVAFPDANRDEIKLRAGFLIVTILSIMAASLPIDLRLVLGVLRMATLGACALNALEYFAGGMLPWQFSNVPGRAAGFYINSNSAAAAIALATPLICLGMRRSTSVMIYLVTGAGVFLTFSRSGLINWVLAVFLTELFVRSGPRSRDRTVFLMMLGFLALLGAVFRNFIMESLIDLLQPYLDDNTTGRLLFNLSDSSTLERLALADGAWRLFLDFPLTGSGVWLGERWTFDRLPHNFYLLTMAEFGVAGLAWLALLLWALVRQPRRFGWVCAGVFGIAALFNHNVIDTPLFAILLALYSAAAIHGGPASLTGPRSYLRGRARRLFVVGGHVLSGAVSAR